MTTPPYDPYGQEPSGTNPYGPDPYWGGQPQGGPPMAGPPQSGPYPPPQGYPYPAPPYGPPYPAPGQQFPGGPMGPYPPGPPPKRPGSKLPWLIGAGVAVAVIVALVAILVLLVGRENESTTAGPSTTAAPVGPSLTPGGPSSAQNATDCTQNVSAGTPPTGDTVSAGALSFPTSAAPGWVPIADDQFPNGIDVVGVAREVPGANNWVMQAEVGITNFVASMNVAVQASKLMTCVAGGPGYEMASPTLGPTKESSITIDGTEAARVDADITIADPARGVPGDSVVIIVVKTKPATFFFATTPIGDAEDRAVIDEVMSALTVTNQ